jgi:hypothetical protein
VKSLVHSACQQAAFAEASKHEHLKRPCRAGKSSTTALNSVVSHGLLHERQRISAVSSEGADVP